MNESAHVNSYIQDGGTVILDKSNNLDKILTIDESFEMKNNSQFNFSNRNREISNFLRVGGDIIIDNSSTMDEGRGLNIAMVGASSQSLTSNITTVDTLILSGGGQKNLQTSLSINALFEMRNGDINTNGDTLTLGSGTTQPGILNHSRGSVLGVFRRWVESGRTTLFMPMGNIDPDDGSKAYHRPARLDFSNNTPSSGGTLDLEFIQEHSGYNGLPLMDSLGVTESDSLYNIGVTGFWSFEANNISGFEYSIELTATDFVDVADSTDTHLVIRDDSTTPWELRGKYSASSAMDGNLVIRRDSLTGFSDMTAAGHEDNPLPVEFAGADITTSHSGEEAIIEWSTATETNNYRFYIDRAYLYGTEGDRSVADTNWTQIGYRAGHGTTSNSHTYRIEDGGLSKAGKYAYRIRQTDYDGTEEVLTILELSVGSPSRTELKDNYPNPFNPVTHVPYKLAEDGEVSIKVYNAAGQQVAVLVEEQQGAGQYEVRFDASSLSSGIYYIRLAANGYRVNKPITLIK